MAELRLRLKQISPNSCFQLRVDGVVAQVPKRDKKRLLSWGEETWPSGGRKFKVEELGHDSKTIITVGTSHPVCAVGGEPARAGAWQDLLVGASGESIALLGMGGTGKRIFATSRRST